MENRSNYWMKTSCKHKKSSHFAAWNQRDAFYLTAVTGKNLEKGYNSVYAKSKNKSFSEVS